MTTMAPVRVQSELDAIDVTLFDPATDCARYEMFHAIRLEVFCRSLGWTLPSDSGRWHDPFDRAARCALAERGGEPIGILRALRASTAFPHRELFEAHIERCGLGEHLDKVGTLNALAVLPAYRRRVYANSCSDARGTAAHLLLRACIDDLASDGVCVVMATVMGLVSARSFLSVGFRLLDLPRSMPGHARFTVANVGLLVSKPEGAGVQGLESVGEHFDECHRHVVGVGPVEELFSSLGRTETESHSLIGSGDERLA